MRCLLSHIVLLLISTSFLSAQSINTAFGTNGKVELAPSQYHEAVDIIAGENDTLYVLANAGVFRPTLDLDAAILKLTPDGELVKTITYDLPGQTYTNAKDIYMLPDNRMLVTAFGYDTANSFNNPAFLTMFHPSGEVDSSFGTDGHLPLVFYKTQEWLLGTRLDAQGRIIVYGSSLDTLVSFRDAAVLGRMDINGVWDTTFGRKGKIEVDLIDGIASIKGPRHLTGGIIYDILEFPNDQLLVAGGYFNFNNMECFFTLINTDDVSIDSTFGVNGTISLDIVPFRNNQAIRLHDLGNGKVLFGASCNQEEGDYYLGTIDMNTSVLDLEAVDIAGGHDNLADVLVCKDGGILLAGVSDELMGIGQLADQDISAFPVTFQHSFKSPHNCELTKLLELSDSTIIGFGTTNTADTFQVNLALIGYDKTVITSIDQHDLPDWQTSKTPDFSLFPNPTSGDVMVSLSNHLRGQSGIVTFTNMLGQEIYQFELSQTNTVDLSNFHPGLYIVTVQTSEGTISRRLVVE